MAAFRSPAFSFRTILFLIAIAGVLPAVVFSGLLLKRFADNERARAERGLVDSTRAIARGIDSQFATAEAAVLALSGSAFLQTGNLADFEKRARRTAADTGRDFVLVGSGGRQLMNTLVPEGTPLGTNFPNLLAKVFSERRTVITEVFQGKSSNRLLAAIGVPVIVDGAVRYALSATLYAKDFAPVMQEPGVPDDWIISIVDRNGVHMARSHGNEQYAGKPLVPRLIEHMKSGGTGVLRNTSLEGIPLITTVQYAPKSQWAVAVGLPVSMLATPLWETLTQLLIIAIVLAALSFFLAFLVARSLDLSIGELSSAASALGRGAVIEPLQSNVKEFNVIGDILARTSMTLRSLTSSLETQVAERTFELSQSNTKLTAEVKRRMETEAQLVQMQKIEAIGQLTGGIAHDFNNMLSVVLGALRLLQRRLQRGDTDVDKFVNAAIDGAERAANLTSRLLAFSRQQPLAPEVMDGNKLIAGMGEILRRTIPESIHIETVLAGGLWRCFADNSGLENAIINLAVNARDAMPGGGKLTIETANAALDDAYAATRPDVSAGQYVMVAVADTGSGMTADVIARAIDPFFTTKPAGQGTGLGLSQVHGFIKQSGGHIAIYSEPGQGTTVKLYLPRHFGDADLAQRRTVRGGDAAVVGNNETLLVVEDDAEVRKVVIEMLAELGYTTIEAENGIQALGQIDARPDIALMITDVVMPGMNGRVLAGEVKARRPGLPVLFTTGYTRNAIVHHGVLDPDVHVIIKPYAVETLATKVRELLQAAKAG
ncbi:hybrid sensor histidine kinase/response regulator [Rhodoplanes sp. Z2-YC6860]|uniref:hybrid sensor histidine kinase/response regulator n=1 Tax=Rhodoplanes sp. Z2-YC6860 TaxID=674703 RepID=UPI001F44895B|nr:ATP-binding protein [Rhodoplanes sp. Z2-YC6860]